MKRGDLFTAELAGDYGKPRPCLIVQSDRLAQLDSVLVCPLTSNLGTSGPARIIVRASEENGLAVDSLVMVDKITAISRSRCRDRIGVVEAGTMENFSGVALFVLGMLE